MRVCARVVPASTVDIILIAPDDYPSQFAAPQPFGDDFDTVAMQNVHRHKRQAYDPYDHYYFHPKSVNRQRQRPAKYDRPDIHDEYISRRDTSGQNYEYTPLFQYKSTQSRRRKLFVPNLFG